MKTIPLFLIGIFFLACLAGCGPGNSRTNGQPVSGKEFEKGKIIPKVACRKDYTISYALYLPKSYSQEKKYPLIIAFDPHASGILPLENYKDLADKYGYILMGSNDSKNGQDMNTSAVIVDALFGETSGRYPIDSSRIYVMGFSGGARMACIVGLYQGGVAGIIGCGAGFPSTNQPIRFRPDYISFAGNADFNMNELSQLDRQLDEAKFTHALILFNGKHAWPPAEVMENAFVWTEFCSMRKGLVAKNNSMIDDYILRQEKIIRQDKESADAVSEHNHLVNLIRFISGLGDTEKYSRMLSELEKSASYKNQDKKLQQLQAKEMNEQQSLNDNFFSKDIVWWKQKLTNYDLRIKNGTDSSDVRMCKRLKSYLSLVSYMNYKRVSSSGDTTAAGHAMAIYEIVDPENAASTKADKGK